MRTNPTLDELVHGARGILKGIQACVEVQCAVSAIALIYAGIDSLAALARPSNQSDTTGEDFRCWVKRYVPLDGLNCTVNDLWGARCGILHTHSAESREQRNDRAKRLIYEWHAGPGAGVEVPLPEGALIVDIEQLHGAFVRAVKAFCDEYEQGPDEFAERIDGHLKTTLCYRPWPRLSAEVAA